MSEKQQGTANHTREKMLNRYGDGFHHKHDKNHILYRKHCRTYPVHPFNDRENEEFQGKTGLLRVIKSRKIRKRLDKGRFH